MDGTLQWIWLFSYFEYPFSAITNIDADFEVEGNVRRLQLLVCLLGEYFLNDPIFAWHLSTDVLMNHNEYS